MLTILAALTFAHAEPVTVLPDVVNYQVGEYTWCDMHLLAAALDASIVEAREAAQALLAEGKGADLAVAIHGARGQLAARTDLCSLLEANISYDAVRMSADLQSIPPAQAHERWVKMLIQGEYTQILSEIESAMGVTYEPPTPAAWAKPKPDDALSFSAWETSAYTWCDAQLLAASQYQSEKVVAIGIGRMVRAGKKAEADKMIAEARTKVPDPSMYCAIWSLPYTAPQLDLIAQRAKTTPTALVPLLEAAARAGKLGEYNFMISPAWEP
jgi:hypothetical protein